MFKWLRNLYKKDSSIEKYEMTDSYDNNQDSNHDNGNNFDYSSLADYSETKKENDRIIKNVNKANKLNKYLLLGNKLPNGKRTRLLLMRIGLFGFVFGLLFLMISFSISREVFNPGSVGEKAVMALYDFKDINELEDQLGDLKRITTESVYNKIAVINADKALNTYLKMHKNPVKVEIIDKQPGIVHYTLHTDSLSDGRQFLFIYKVNWLGKICYVNEMEGIGFY